MSFFSAVEHLQKKPRAARVRITAFLVAVAMAGVVAVWVINLRSSLFVNDEPAATDSVRPFTLIHDMIANGFAAVKNEAEKLPLLANN